MTDQFTVFFVVIVACTVGSCFGMFLAMNLDRIFNELMYRRSRKEAE